MSAAPRAKIAPAQGSQYMGKGFCRVVARCRESKSKHPNIPKHQKQGTAQATSGLPLGLGLQTRTIYTKSPGLKPQPRQARNSPASTPCSRCILHPHTAGAFITHVESACQGNAASFCCGLQARTALMRFFESLGWQSCKRSWTLHPHCPAVVPRLWLAVL